MLLLMASARLPGPCDTVLSILHPGDTPPMFR